MKNTAKKLTLEEIIALPRGSVVWGSFENITNEGIVWYEADPMMVSVPGENGLLIGSDTINVFERNIDDTLFYDPVVEAIDSDSEFIIWDHEPTKGQLHGISCTEYNAMPDDFELIQFTRLAYAITYRGFTFEQISDMTGIRHKRMWSILTGKSDIEQCEIVAIRDALDLSDDETLKVFFPEHNGIRYDIGSGRVILPAEAAQI